jgi:hypothetical protein
VAGAVFAERFLVRPSGGSPPEPDSYDEERSISVTADGRPFIESGGSLDTRTLTEADGEGSDYDQDETRASLDGRRQLIDPLLETKTMTFTDAEASDDDRDRHIVAAGVHTDTRADGERPDSPPWAHTETAAPGEPSDYDRLLTLTTVTKAEGERDD